MQSVGASTMNAFLTAFTSPFTRNNAEKANRPSETKRIEWIVDYNPANIADVVYQFEIGETISFPTKWEFMMRRVKGVESKEYIGIYARRVDVNEPPHPVGDGKKHDRETSTSELESPPEILVSWKIYLHMPGNEKPIAKGGECLDFGKAHCLGLPLFDIEKVHLFKFEDEKLKFQFDFTLFGPVSKPEEEKAKDVIRAKKNQLREQAYIRCDENIYNQLGNRELSNVTVKSSDGKAMYCHQIALARSPYFAELLRKARSEEGAGQSKQLVLNVDKPFDSMSVILCHIHFGQLLDELLDPRIYDLPFAKGLAKMAAEYGLEELQKYLVEFYPGLKDELKKEEEGHSAKKMKMQTENKEKGGGDQVME